MLTTNHLLPFFRLVNDTEVGPLQTVDISNPDTTKWVMRDLEPMSKYKFYLRSCTTLGCGPVVSEECTTTLQTSEWWRVQKAIDWAVYVCGLVGGCVVSLWRQWERRRALRRRIVGQKWSRWQSHFTISKWHWTSEIWYMPGQPSFSYLHVSNFCG